MQEAEDRLAAFDLHRIIDRPGEWDGFSVVLGEGDECESLAHVPLIAGMKVPGFSDVNGDGLAGIRQLER